MSHFHNDDKSGMRWSMVFILCLWVGVPCWGQDRKLPTLPLPRLITEEDSGPTPDANFARTLQKLRSEREALNADWDLLKRRRTPTTTPIEIEQQRFTGELNRALKRLHQTRPKPASEAPSSADPSPAASKNTETKPMQTAVLSEDSPRFERIDPLAQAHALMRNKQYGEALKAFDQVDLKLRKSDDRAPILYLKACCYLNLGKTKEAIDLLQEVANYRGEEKLASYAQWQLEELRWRREIDLRLQDIRQRQQAVEKR